MAPLSLQWFADEYMFINNLSVLFVPCTANIHSPHKI